MRTTYFSIYQFIYFLIYFIIHKQHLFGSKLKQNNTWKHICNINIFFILEIDLKFYSRLKQHVCFYKLKKNHDTLKCIHNINIFFTYIMFESNLDFYPPCSTCDKINVLL
jgi:hypothetical protein